MKSQAGIDALGFGYGRAFLCEVGCKAVDAAFGEILATGLAAMVVAVAIIVELRASFKELENQWIRPATHLAIGPWRLCASGEAAETWEIIKLAE
jgi:hypothetical protein